MKLLIVATVALWSAVSSGHLIAPDPCNNTGNRIITTGGTTCTPSTVFCPPAQGQQQGVACGQVCTYTPDNGVCDATIQLNHKCCWNTTRWSTKTTYACDGTECKGTSTNEVQVSWGQIEDCKQDTSSGVWMNTANCTDGTVPPDV